MKKITRKFNAIWFLTILFSAVSMQGMESNSGWLSWIRERSAHSFLGMFIETGLHVAGYNVFSIAEQEEDSEESLIDDRISDEEADREERGQAKQIEKCLSLQAKEYNDNDCLLTTIKLPKELISIEIFPHCLAQDVDQIESLQNSIKNFMKLRAACKKFNTLLTFEAIGDFCKNYAQGDKDQMLQNLIVKPVEKTSWPKIDNLTGVLGYERKRLPILILLCAGADTNTIDLTYSALSRNDAQVVTMLFKHHADPHAKTKFGYPIIFCAGTEEIVQICVDNGVDVHATYETVIVCHDTEEVHSTNILWHIIGKKDSLDLVEFYLKNNVDATQLNTYDNSCLLHKLAGLLNNDFPFFEEEGLSQEELQSAIDDFLAKAALLLNAMPTNVVNTLNNDEQTPLDVAQNTLQFSQECRRKKTVFAFEQIIALLRKHGGLTAQELAGQKIAPRK